MMKTLTYPKVESVRPISGRLLFVQFRNGEQRIYDCRPLLKNAPFAPLADDALFRCVKADAGGYGISWNDEIDLAESELWLKGKKTGSTPVRRRRIAAVS